MNYLIKIKKLEKKLLLKLRFNIYFRNDFIKNLVKKNNRSHNYIEVKSKKTQKYFTTPILKHFYHIQSLFSWMNAAYYEKIDYFIDFNNLIYL